MRRFIPAPAGNTPAKIFLDPSQPVHPRACGEHFVKLTQPTSERGSSPRLRGTQYYVREIPNRSRFIPAPAGNTQYLGSGQRPLSVHPRACGEHASTTSPAQATSGSSPRLRGTLYIGESGEDAVRFIPAPAGNTGFSLQWPTILTVHPRACGEHQTRLQVLRNSIGSSPRLRGTRRVKSAAEPSRSVHPRACGEHFRMASKCLSDPGSSPRLRGTPGPDDGGIPRDRFIPAPAGNT